MNESVQQELCRVAEGVWDVVVVGAGPAGSLATREVARSGLKVLLVEKSPFPRFKVCGCCLNQRSLATLESVGLGQQIDRLGAVPLRQMCWAESGHRALLALPGGASVSRSALDAALVDEAIDAGAQFLSNTFARLGPAVDSFREVHLSRGGESVTVNARMLLAADGLGSNLLAGEQKIHHEIRTDSKIGAGAIAEIDAPDYEPHVIYMACGQGGYVGAVRVEDGRLNLAAALDPSIVKSQRGLHEAVATVIAQSGLPPVAGIADMDWRGTPLLTRHLSALGTERVLVLGDAAGYVEPFTGEGIAWALTLGAAVAPLAGRGAKHWNESLIDEWAEVYRRIVRRRQWVCRAVATALRHPRLTRSVVTTLSYAPGLAKPVVRWLNAKHTKC